MPFYTPLRYPGGKGELANFMKLVFWDNQLMGTPYVEPYAGGAAVAISLLFEGFTSIVHINDVNPSVYSFWYAVLNHTEELCRLITDTPVTIEERTRQKEIQDLASQASYLELGFSTFFLNRTNRSGIIKGGVIGGKNQDGTYKLDARYNKADLVSRIERIASYRDQIRIYNLDAIVLLQSLLPRLPEHSVIYLDPPYYVKGQGLYENFYNNADHLQVADLARTIRQNWIVSYDDVPEIQQMYRGFQSLNYRLHYHAANRYQGGEVMFFTPNLTVPQLPNPPKVPTQYLRQFAFNL